MFKIITTKLRCLLVFFLSIIIFSNIYFLIYQEIPTSIDIVYFWVSIMAMDFIEKYLEI